MRTKARFILKVTFESNELLCNDNPLQQKNQSRLDSLGKKIYKIDQPPNSALLRKIFSKYIKLRYFFSVKIGYKQMNNIFKYFLKNLNSYRFTLKHIIWLAIEHLFF